MLSLSPAWPPVAAGLLGAFHGINPAMGWLFAVALGLQDGRRRSVVAALAPIALGHATSVGLVILLIGALRPAIPSGFLRAGAAAVLIGFGLFRLARPWAHPRWVGMRVGFRDLTLWSVLMSSAHGAGLMLAPVVLGGAGGLALLAIHTVAMFLMMGLVAVLVYEVVGTRLLRRAWVNLDLLWALALVLAGVATLLVPMHPPSTGGAAPPLHTLDASPP
ncbi:MAG TPA: hypothetical protein VFT84_01355 [Gemmatimonadales bacterium]|nr:hypothetical protein [Gemmatimonadales bacterium]